MPNGVDRDFIRFLSCISGFKAKFHHWPTKVRLDPDFIEELKDVMTDEDFQKMTKRIELISDNRDLWDGLYMAEDDEGNVYDLMKNGHGPHEVDVLDWLGIKMPDYGPD